MDVAGVLKGFVVCMIGMAQDVGMV